MNILLQVAEQHTITIQFAVYLSILIVAVTTTIIVVKTSTANNTKDIADLKKSNSEKADLKLVEDHVKSRDAHFKEINEAIAKLEKNEIKFEQIMLQLCGNITEMKTDIKELLKK